MDAVDELHAALAAGVLFVGEDPDVGRDAGVVEHVGRQGDDGLQQVAFKQMAADLALAGARAAGEKRGAVEDDADAGAALPGIAQLAQEMQEEEKRAVGDARQPGAEASLEAFEGVFIGDGAFDLFPIHAEGRVGEHVIELLAVELILGERVAELDAGDVLPLDEHVGLADGVALGVELLAEGAHDGLGVELVHVFHARGEETAGARGGIVNGADDAGLGEGVVVLHEDVSLELSAKRRMSSSKTRPISWLETADGLRSDWRTRWTTL